MAVLSTSASRFFHDDQKRPFTPLGMRQPDHRSFCHTRAADSDIFYFDGRNPLTTRFDHVLVAICDLHETQWIDGSRCHPVSNQPSAVSTCSSSLKYPLERMAP